MKTNTAFGIFMLGLIVTMFGVGGVENSIADSELLSSLAVSAVGLLLMWVSTLAMRNTNYYDER
jgi:hypothetical protein